MSMFSLDGKKAMVTGATRGIGFAIAKAMAEAGADIVLVARDEAKLKEAGEHIEAMGRKTWTFSHDMSDTKGVNGMFEKVLAATGGVDILVNNAGGARRGPAQDITDEDWDFVLTLNLKSVFAMCRAFGRERIASGRPGKIVNIASLLSEAVRENNASYAASKGGVRQLTKALAVDWARHKINVNCFGPGYIQTELTRPLWEDEKFDSWIKQRTPLGRWGKPEDLAPTAVFLASPAADFITGQIFYVDGGFLSTF